MESGIIPGSTQEETMVTQDDIKREMMLATESIVIQASKGNDGPASYGLGAVSAMKWILEGAPGSVFTDGPAFETIARIAARASTGGSDGSHSNS